MLIETIVTELVSTVDCNIACMEAPSRTHVPVLMIHEEIVGHPDQLRLILYGTTNTVKHAITKQLSISKISSLSIISNINHAFTSEARTRTAKVSLNLNKSRAPNSGASVVVDATWYVM